jgi:hypothetical protein
MAVAPWVAPRTRRPWTEWVVPRCAVALNPDARHVTPPDQPTRMPRTERAQGWVPVPRAMGLLPADAGALLRVVILSDQIDGLRSRSTRGLRGAWWGRDAQRGAT